MCSCVCVGVGVCVCEKGIVLTSVVLLGAYLWVCKYELMNRGNHEQNQNVYGNKDILKRILLLRPEMV